MLDQAYQLLDTRKAGEYVSSLGGQTDKRAELDSLSKLIARMDGADKTHLVSELVQLKGCLGLRVTEKVRSVKRTRVIFTILPPPSSHSASPKELSRSVRFGCS